MKRFVSAVVVCAAALAAGTVTTLSGQTRSTPATSGCFADTLQSDFQNNNGAANCDLTTSPGSIILNFGGPAAIDQQNTTVTTAVKTFGLTATVWAGQTFTAAVNGTVPKVDLELAYANANATPPPNISVSIRATSGGLPTGPDLQTAATITAFTSTTATFYTATFGTPVSVNAGTQYAIVFRVASNMSPNVYTYRCSCTSPDSNPYAGGTIVTSGSTGTTWAADATAGGRDMAFKVWVTPLSVYASTGTFTSSTKDANPAPGGAATWNTLAYAATTPAGTTLQFRVAGSNNPGGPFNFVGPDGTANTSFSNGASLAQFNGFRYLRYQASMTSNGANTPTITDVVVCYTKTPQPLLDLDADGTGDAFSYDSSSGAWKRAIADGSGAFVESNGSWDPNWTVTPARFNSDNSTDVLLFNPTSGQWFRMLSNGTGWTTQAFGTWWPGWQRFVMDLNGDGLSDVFLYDPTSGVWFKAVLSSPGGDFTYSQGGWNPDWEITPMTLNADGFGDMFLINRSTGRWFWVLGEAGASFSYPATDAWFASWNLYPGDFNGDGLSDLLLHYPTSGQYFVAMNNGLGTGFTYSSGAWSLGWTPYVGDLDADGDADIFLHSASTGQWFEMIGNGAGSFSVGGSQTWSLGWNLYPTDLNGDDRVDFLLYHPTTGVWYQARNLAIGTFNYTTGNWSPGLTILVGTPFK